MRLGFSTQEAYFTILGVLIVLSAIGTIIGNWLVSRAQGNEAKLNNLRVVNSRVRASWPLLIVLRLPSASANLPCCFSLLSRLSLLCGNSLR